MKLKVLAVVAGCLSLQLAFAAPNSGSAVGPLKTEKDKYSYSIGVDIGKNLKAQSLNVNAEMLGRGITDGFSGDKTLLTDEQMRETLQALQQRMVANQAKKMKDLADKNMQDGQAFLAKNKTSKGVKTMKDGLQYKVIDQGKGAMPKLTDSVTVDYEGKLIDGKVFDSSYQRGQPATFKVSDVIEGWQQALTNMKEGATWEVYVPSKLAYGDKGLGGPIGPNETLIFKIHLIAIDKNNAKK